MEMMNVHIASAQYPITAHSGMEAWQAHTRQWVKTGRDSGAQILLFPEYGSMELVSLAGKALFHDIKAQLHALQDYVNPFKTHYQALAKEYMVILVAPSIPVKTVTGFVNRAYVFGSDGQYGYQDKLFMTRFEDEEWGVSPGEKVLTIFEAPWGSFGIQICYDIEFPTGSALLCDAGASIILAPSCTEDRFGASRVHTGARARALENQCYVVASQTVGTSVCSYAVEDNFGYGAFYCTPDALFPESPELAVSPPQQEGWLSFELDLEHIKAVRTSGSVLNYRDRQKTLNGLVNKELRVQKVSIA